MPTCSLLSVYIKIWYHKHRLGNTKILFLLSLGSILSNPVAVDEFLNIRTSYFGRVTSGVRGRVWVAVRCMNFYSHKWSICTYYSFTLFSRNWEWNTMDWSYWSLGYLLNIGKKSYARYPFFKVPILCIWWEKNVDSIIFHMKQNLRYLTDF